MVETHSNVIKSIKTALEEAISKSTLVNLIEDKKIITDLHLIHDTEYSEAKVRQAKFELIIQELEDLRKQLGILLEDKNRILETLESEKGTKKKLQVLFYQRHQLNLGLYGLIKSAVSEIAGKSEGTLEIELTDLENIDNIVVNFIRQITSTKGQPDRTQAFFHTLININ